MKVDSMLEYLRPEICHIMKSLVNCLIGRWMDHSFVDFTCSLAVNFFYPLTFFFKYQLYVITAMHFY